MYYLMVILYNLYICCVIQNTIISIYLSIGEYNRLMLERIYVTEDVGDWKMLAKRQHLPREMLARGILMTFLHH